MHLPPKQRRRGGSGAACRAEDATRRPRLSRGRRHPAAEVDRRLPALEGPQRDPLELPRHLQPVEQPRSVTGDDRVDDQAILIDEIQPLQLGAQLWAAEQHAGGRIVLDLLHRGAQVALQVARRSPCRWMVFSQEKSRRVLETTYFGLASSFTAHSRIARGAFSSRAMAGQALSIIS